MYILLNTIYNKLDNWIINNDQTPRVPLRPTCIFTGRQAYIIVGPVLSIQVVNNFAYHDWFSENFCASVVIEKRFR